MASPGTEAWARSAYGAPCHQPIVTIDFLGRNVTVNKKCQRHFKRLARIFAEKSPNYAVQIDDFLDDWGYACRKIGSSSTYSNHAFGIAIDIDATKNVQGRRYQDTLIWKRAADSVLQAEREGFRWGGRYSTTPDAMHFETLLTPAQINARYYRNGRRKLWYIRKLRKER